MSQLNLLDYAYTNINDSITSGLGRNADDSMTDKAYEVFERVNGSYGSIYISTQHTIDDINDYIVRYTHGFLGVKGVKILMRSKEFRTTTMELFEEQIDDLRGFAHYILKQLEYEEDIRLLDMVAGTDTDDHDDNDNSYLYELTDDDLAETAEVSE